MTTFSYPGKLADVVFSTILGTLGSRLWAPEIGPGILSLGLWAWVFGLGSWDFGHGSMGSGPQALAFWLYQHALSPSVWALAPLRLYPGPDLLAL